MTPENRFAVVMVALFVVGVALVAWGLLCR